MEKLVGQKTECFFCGDEIKLIKGKRVPYGKCPTCKSRIFATKMSEKLWAMEQEVKAAKATNIEPELIEPPIDQEEPEPPTPPKPIIPEEPAPEPVQEIIPDKPIIPEEPAPEPVQEIISEPIPVHDPTPEEQKKKEGEDKKPTYKGWG